MPDPEAARLHRQTRPALVFWQEKAENGTDSYWTVAHPASRWQERLHLIICRAAWENDNPTAKKQSCHFACNDNACLSCRHLRHGTPGDNRADNAQVRRNNRWASAKKTPVFPKPWAAAAHQLEEDGFDQL